MSTTTEIIPAPSHQLHDPGPQRLAVPAPEALIQLAIERNVGVEAMEKLLAMRKELKAEAAREAFFRDLSLFQDECPTIPKTAAVQEKNSNSVRYKFAKLETVVEVAKPSLTKYGFSYRFTTSTYQKPGKDKNGKDCMDDYVKVVCIATHRDGHSEETYFESQVDAGAYMTVQQKAGSAQSFAKRYALQNAFGIVTGDDDDDSQSTVDDNSKLAQLRRRHQRGREMEMEPIMNRGPQEDDPPPVPIETHIEEQMSEDFKDILSSISAASDAAELTRCTVDYATLKSKTERTAAKVAISTRGKALGLTWNEASKSYAE